MLTGRQRYPQGTQQVVAFSRPLADNEMLELIKRGRSEATVMSPGGAMPEGPEQGISWAGAALRIPAALAIETPHVRRRRREKGPDGAAGQSAPVLPVAPAPAPGQSAV